MEKIQNNAVDYGKSLDKIKADPFTPIYNHTQLKEIAGYADCLRDIQTYLAVTTEYKPENRYVDSVKILEGIIKANKTISELLEKAKNDIPDPLFTKPEGKLHPVFEDILNNFTKPIK